METKLKPCPFCGAKADLIKSIGTKDGSPKAYHPCCHNKDCIMFTGGRRYKNEEEAVEAWNRRVSSD